MKKIIIAIMLSSAGMLVSGGEALASDTFRGMVCQEDCVCYCQRGSEGDCECVAESEIEKAEYENDIKEGEQV